jgi:hypothetical protein
MLAAAAAAATALCVIPSTADAQRRGAVEIRFARGATCWVYQGGAHRFTGRFFEGQTLRIRVRGTPRDDRWVAVGPRSQGPGEDVYDRGSYDVPYTGRYDFVIYPRAIQGAPGTLQICTRG